MLFFVKSLHYYSFSFVPHQSVNQGGDQELENLVTKLAILKDLLSSIEKKVHRSLYVDTHMHAHAPLFQAHIKGRHSYEKINVLFSAPALLFKRQQFPFS